MDITVSRATSRLYRWHNARHRCRSLKARRFGSTWGRLWHSARPMNRRRELDKRKAASLVEGRSTGWRMRLTALWHLAAPTWPLTGANTMFASCRWLSLDRLGDLRTRLTSALSCYGVRIVPPSRISLTIGLISAITRQESSRDPALRASSAMLARDSVRPSRFSSQRLSGL